MMNSLDRKLLRDIWKNKLQFLTIFIMVFLGVFCFAGIHAYMDGMAESGSSYYKHQNLQDLWAYSTNFSKKDVDGVKKINNVKNAERKLTVTTTLNGFKDVSLDTNFIESNEISKFHVTSGEKFTKGKAGVWVDSYLADNIGLKLGDMISLKYKKYNIKEKILGLITVPDHMYSIKDDTAIFPNHKDWGFAYMSIEQFPDQIVYDEVKKHIAEKNPLLESSKITNAQVHDLVPGFKISKYRVFNTMMIDVNDTSKIGTVKKDIRKKIDGITALTERKDDISYSSYEAEIDEGKTYSTVFTALFLFIAALSVVTTMNRFVRKQRIQIGTMKALGIRRGKIVHHYMAFGFLISLLGAALGIAVGCSTIGKYFLDMEVSYFELPNPNTVILPAVYAMAAATVIVVMFVTYLSTAGILKEKAADSIRVEAPKHKKRKFKMTTCGLLYNGSLSTKWSLRDIARNKGRSIMALVGVIGCTMLVIVGFGMRDTMTNYMEWEFSDLCNFNYKMTLDKDITNKEYEALKNVYGNATSQTVNIETELKNENLMNTLVVTDAGKKLRFTDEKKQFMSLSDDGIYVTVKYARLHGINVGDIISWHITGADKVHKTKVVGFNRDPQNQGYTMTKKCFISEGEKYRADTMYTDKKLSESKTLSGVKKITSIVSLRKGMGNMLNTVNSMIFVMLGAAALLAFVIIYNLGILSFSEKEYQFATLRVLGYKNKQIEKIFKTQNIWITTAAIILAIPLGYLMVDYIFRNAIGDAFDLTANVNVISYVAGALFTLAVSYLVGLLLARNIRKIDIVSSLKSNE